MSRVPGWQVARYSALFFGIGYGLVHRQTLQAKLDHHNADNEIHKREEWLKQAKKAWAAKQQKEGGRESTPSARHPKLGLAILPRSLAIFDC